MSIGGRLDGQVALVTGGASGLGLGIVRRFVAEGARVAVLDRSAERLDALAAELGGAVRTVAGDVRGLAANREAVEACVERFGRLDVAVGNAGVWDYNATLVGIPEDRLADAFHELFDINVLGYLMLAKASVRALAESKGSLLYTLSNAAFYPAGGGPLYTASKHAVLGLVRQLAHELSPHVRVNGVAPGGIATDLRGPEALGLAEAEFPGAMIEEMSKGALPVGRLPTIEEYGGAYLFLATRAESFPATGTVMNFDGGMGVIGFGAPRPSASLLADLGIEGE